jgi:NRPS condensation-like uncharacterized protein
VSRQVRADPLDTLVAETQHRAWPSIVHVELTAGGTLDSVRLQRAVDAVVARHPLVAARMHAAPPYRRLPMWVVDDVPTIAIDTVDAADFASVRFRRLSDHVDLRRHPPVRIVHAPGGPSDRLAVFAHHAALDGVATTHLVGAIADEYAGRCVTEHDAAIDAPHAPPTARRAGAPAAPSPWPGPRRATGLLGGALRREQWARLAMTDPHRHERDGSDVVLDEWGAELTARLLRSRPPQVTVNDVVVTATHVACRRWNGPADERAISVAIPIDSWRGARRPLGNATLQGITVSRPDDHRDLAALLRSIHAQNVAIKSSVRSERGGAIRVAGNLPAGLRRAAIRATRMLTADRFVTTTRCSNLGRLATPDFGLAPARNVAGRADVYFSPPTRPPVAITLGIVGDGSNVRVAVRRCRPLIDAAAADRFARLVRDAADELIDAASAR